MPAGRCLCGAVRFDVRGPLRGVLFCHCAECRRWSGHVWAATAARRADVVFTEERGLRWIASPASDAHAQRGFCAECGTSLFWEAPGRDTLSISAGAFEPSAGIAGLGHTYVAQAPGYDVLPDDGLPHYERLPPR